MMDWSAGLWDSEPECPARTEVRGQGWEASPTSRRCPRPFSLGSEHNGSSMGKDTDVCFRQKNSIISTNQERKFYSPWCHISWFLFAFSILVIKTWTWSGTISDGRHLLIQKGQMWLSGMWVPEAVWSQKSISGAMVHLSFFLYYPVLWPPNL